MRVRSCGQLFLFAFLLPFLLIWYANTEAEPDFENPKAFTGRQLKAYLAKYDTAGGPGTAATPGHRTSTLALSERREFVARAREVHAARQGCGACLGRFFGVKGPMGRFVVGLSKAYSHGMEPGQENSGWAWGTTLFWLFSVFALPILGLSVIRQQQYRSDMQRAIDNSLADAPNVRYNPLGQAAPVFWHPWPSWDFEGKSNEQVARLTWARRVAPEARAAEARVGQEDCSICLNALAGAPDASGGC